MPFGTLPAGELFHQDGLPQQLGRAVAGAVAGAAQSVGWLGGWLGDISMVHGFFWKTPWWSFGQFGMFSSWRIHVLQMNWETSCVACFLLSGLGMGFGHLVKLNAVLKVFPVVAIVGGKPFASNTTFWRLQPLRFLCRPNGACFFWGVRN